MLYFLGLVGVWVGWGPPAVVRGSPEEEEEEEEEEEGKEEEEETEPAMEIQQTISDAGEFLLERIRSYKYVL